MANNALQPNKAKPVIEPIGEGREPERDFKVADQFTAKISEYSDIADLFGARAENLFKKNQKRSKDLGIKGFDKTSALYRQWYNTTQVVKLADKIANIYKKGAEAADTELTQAEEMEKELDDTRMALDLTRAEAWDESDAAKELTDRWAGTETPKAKSAAELVSDIYLSDSSVNKDKFALEQRRAAEKVAAEETSLRKQISMAKKEAERITAEQKEQVKVDKYEKSIKGSVGWFKRLFKGHEQKAAEAAAKEQAELTRAGVEADAQLERKWTEADERAQEKQLLKPGLLQRGLDKRGLDVVERTIANVRARGIDNRLDKKLARENAAAADLEDWKEEVDESVAKRGIMDKVLSRFEANPEKQGAKMMEKMEKGEAKEAARLKKWGEKAAAADLEDWKEEVDESVAKRGIVDKALSHFDANPEKQGAKLMEKQDQTEAQTRAAINKKIIKFEKRIDDRTKRDQTELEKLKKQAVG